MGSLLTVFGRRMLTELENSQRTNLSEFFALWTVYFQEKRMIQPPHFQRVVEVRLSCMERYQRMNVIFYVRHQQALVFAEHPNRFLLKWWKGISQASEQLAASVEAH